MKCMRSSFTWLFIKYFYWRYALSLSLSSQLAWSTFPNAALHKLRKKRHRWECFIVSNMSATCLHSLLDGVRCHICTIHLNLNVHHMQLKSNHIVDDVPNALITKCLKCNVFVWENGSLWPNVVIENIGILLSEPQNSFIYSRFGFVPIKRFLNWNHWLKENINFFAQPNS